MRNVLCLFAFWGTLSIAYGAGGSVGDSSSGKSTQGHAEGTETTKLLRLGYRMVLECKINPDEKADSATNMPLTSWSKDDIAIGQEDSRYKIFQENSTLVIVSPTVEDVGFYQCQAANFHPVRSYNITVVYLTVRSMAKSTTVFEGDKLSISCDVDGNPPPTIMWFKDGVNVDEAVNVTRFELADNGKGMKNGTYVVEKAIYDDRANYTCFIASGDIQYNATTFVRVKDMYAALWPFLGICAEVFILCLIIFVYEKRRAKMDFEESDTDQPPEQKNPSDQNTDSVRQRK